MRELPRACDHDRAHANDRRCNHLFLTYPVCEPVPHPAGPPQRRGVLRVRSPEALDRPEPRDRVDRWIELAKLERAALLLAARWAATGDFEAAVLG